MLEPRGSSSVGSLVASRLKLWKQVRCPHCSALIPQPFARLKVAVSNTHQRPSDPHGARCRVIVVPDPTGDKDQVTLVPHGVEAYTVLQRVLESLAA